MVDYFSLDWWTVDIGGDVWTTGGDFELSGTSGQDGRLRIKHMGVEEVIIAYRLP